MKIGNIMIVMAFLAVENAFGQEKEKFHMKASHTPQECLNTIDAAKSKGESFLSMLEWGCMWGDHTAYAYISGVNETAIKKMLPAKMQENAIINRVGKFTIDEIERMHAIAD